MGHFIWPALSLTHFTCSVVRYTLAKWIVSKNVPLQNLRPVASVIHIQCPCGVIRLHPVYIYCIYIYIYKCKCSYVTNLRSPKLLHQLISSFQPSLPCLHTVLLCTVATCHPYHKPPITDFHITYILILPIRFYLLALRLFFPYPWQRTQWTPDLNGTYYPALDYRYLI